ncbi:hypothetical protein [Cellulomonas sp. URHE0023]|uniref:hypothetical protein n=1 Tax=Cellulomonas sp. URHE0023 TaxID=1380354 RepID=UPI00047F39F0|nr:hypothetical protein [Cellulomonas sp. URHE0023]
MSAGRSGRVLGLGAGAFIVLAMSACQSDPPVNPIGVITTCEAALKAVQLSASGESSALSLADAESATLTECATAEEWMRTGMQADVRSTEAELRSYLEDLCDAPGNSDTRVCEDVSHGRG